jgi:hypothetical protein
MHRRLWLLAGLAVVAAGMAAQVSPANAARPMAAGTAFCAPAVFSSLDRLVTPTSARASKKTVREPGLTVAPAEVPGSAAIAQAAAFAATIPVYWHVITDGENGDVSDAEIAEQMTALNLSFAGFYGGEDTGFVFELVDVDRTDNAAWFNTGPGSKPERDMKKALRQGGANALNVYSTSGEAFLGWATFPSSFKTKAYYDGIVIDYRSMPGGPYGSNFSLGFTLSHEAGHWLGLYHTFQGGCNNKGDYVPDTPSMKVPTSGCPPNKDTCKQPGLDPIHNYMDYSFDSCYTEFTEGQSARMHQQYEFFRA